MNIEKLEVGKSFKNYKELCAELGLEVRTSVGTKNAQFRELDRYCRYSKIGHKITITDVFEEPLEKVDGRGKSEGTQKAKTLYGDAVQLLILDILAQSKSKSVSISRSKLLLTIKMVNSNYSICGENVKQLSRYTDIEEAIIYDFYNTSKSSLKNVIEGSLNKLKDKSIIIFDTVTKIHDRKTKKHRLAEDAEKKEIIRINKTVLDELGYENMSEVMFSKDWKRFKRKTKELFHKETNIDYYYAAYNIVANEEYLDKEAKSIKDFLLEKAKRDEAREELNDVVYDNLTKNANKRKEEKFGFSSKIFRTSDNYVGDMKMLISLLIDSSSKSILSDILKIENVEQLDEDQINSINDFF